MFRFQNYIVTKHVSFVKCACASDCTIVIVASLSLRLRKYPIVSMAYYAITEMPKSHYWSSYRKYGVVTSGTWCSSLGRLSVMARKKSLEILPAPTHPHRVAAILYLGKYGKYEIIRTVVYIVHRCGIWYFHIVFCKQTKLIACTMPVSFDQNC